MQPSETLFQQLNAYSSSPILFIGSGISFRYLGTERWEALLKRFSEQIGIPFEKFRSKANGDWARVGSLLAEDYHTYWFSSPDMESNRKKYKNDMTHLSSPLKVMVSQHLKEFSVSNDYNLESEIGLLRAAKIDGIITTNYDLFLENIFPDFKVYKSQRELIFSTLQEVGEIYKIHGCCTDPNSLVITSEDYENYNSKNAYLAAKLMTAFLEHPIIFLGYSITDPNIRNILKSMITCLDKYQIEELSKRLFFVEYQQGCEEILIEKYNLDIGGSSLLLTRILADSYIEIYNALAALHRRYPASLLRKIKEHIYELVINNDPTEKIAVVDFNSTTDLEQVEVVLGVGVKSTVNEAKGYTSYTSLDLAYDILQEDHKLNANDVCIKTLPQIYRATSWIPICKYVSQITDKIDIDPKFVLRANKPLDDWKCGLPQSHKIHEINAKYASMEDLLSTIEPKLALTTISLLNIDKINTNTLRKFLLENKSFVSEHSTKSYWMRLVCLLDRLEFGAKSSVRSIEPEVVSPVEGIFVL
ncbi:hypothetical protein GO730_02845 [Spirosoma sp. HMF3257]|uniref:Uncharacterized protein n=1 Tax=Spirosoma telluris TaxID=2183553 RepID=A0A327NHX0_9BACT|nr:hypothetical protein [Spirosoma telluris]RAI73616.1 hypothetical protein HMF3257_02785 [Spirosoma telluris]